MRAFFLPCGLEGLHRLRSADLLQPQDTVEVAAVTARGDEVDIAVSVHSLVE